MREPPDDVTPADVLRAVREHWDADVTEAEHLPVGFGAHHWVASVGGRRAWFVTLDALLPRHTTESLEAAYAGAARLASRLDFVLACLPTHRGGFTVPFAGGALSVAPWLDGSSGDRSWTEDDTRSTAAMLTRLHTAEAPDLPAWRPLLAQPGVFADELARSTAQPWDGGPYGEPARQALDQALGDIRHWAHRYDDLARTALEHEDAWVPTHGEPDGSNQLLAHGHRFLIDWESLRRAPRERDLWALGPGWQQGYDAPVDTALLELFDLEWRLAEIAEFAGWFCAPHADGENEAEAFHALLGELDRPDRS